MRKKVQIDTSEAVAALQALEQQVSQLKAQLDSLKQSLSGLGLGGGLGFSGGAQAGGAPGQNNQPGVNAPSGIAGAAPISNLSQVLAGASVPGGGGGGNAAPLGPGLGQPGGGNNPPGGGGGNDLSNLGNTAFKGLVAHQVASSVAGVANAYTQAVVSGQPNEMGIGSAAGNAIGGALGFAVGGPVGAAIGATLGGPIVNALQAGYVRDKTAALSILGLNAANGGNATDLYATVSVLQDQANAINLPANMNASEALLRKSGLYTGVDQTSVQDLAKVYSTIGGAMFNRGSDYMSRGGAMEITQRMARRFGLDAPQVATDIAPLFEDSDAYREEDLLFKYGPKRYSEYRQARGEAKSDFREQYSKYKMSDRAARVQGIQTDINEMGLATDQFSGNSLSQGRQFGDFEEIGRSLRQEASMLRDKRRSVLEAGGDHSETFYTVEREIKQNEFKQAQLQNRESTQFIGETYARSGTQQAQLSVPMAKAQILGTGDDVRKTSGDLVNAFGDEAKSLQAQLSRPGLTFEQKEGIKKDIAGLQERSVVVQEQMRDVAYSKDDITNYNIPAIRLNAERAIQQYMPFSPGNRMKNDVGILQNDVKQLGELDKREAQLRSEGALSPERQQGIEAERARLRLESAEMYGDLGFGMENRLPALSAGRNRTFGQYDSIQLAQMAVHRVHSPVREYGAINGAHKAELDAYMDGFNIGPTGPGSRTQGINNAGSSDAVVALLSRIANALDRNSGRVGSGQRPSEQAGQAYGAISQSKVVGKYLDAN